MNIKQIPKMISYKEKVYHELKQAIINNELKQGEMLNERTLAVKLGISRTPIREALHLLENEGWVETEPCRGTWVKEITEKDVSEVYQMRTALETLAVELAIEQISDEQNRGIMQILKQQLDFDTDMDVNTFTTADMDFHLYIAKISGNRRLFQSMESFMDIMNMYVIRTIRRTQPYSVPIREHAIILNAILQKDVALAKEAVIGHIARARVTAIENLTKIK